MMKSYSGAFTEDFPGVLYNTTGIKQGEFITAENSGGAGTTFLGPFTGSADTGGSNVIVINHPSTPSTYSLDGCVFNGEYNEKQSGTIPATAISYTYRVRQGTIAGDILYYLDYDDTLSNPAGKRYSLAGIWSHNIHITYTAVSYTHLTLPTIYSV